MTAATAIARVNEEHSLGVTLGERCPGGEVGAYYASAADGRRLVFKWSDDPLDRGQFDAVCHRVDHLRARGHLAPRYLPPCVVEGGVVLFQEAMLGSWRDEVDASLVEHAIRLVELQAGAADVPGGWASYVQIDGADDYCLHEPLRRHSPETRRLVERIESIGHDVGGLPEGDLVHLDFHHRNILRDDDRLVAVVDWEGCRPGDRAFDLVTFCFGMTHAHAEPAVFEPAWARATEMTTADALAAYGAHMALRRVDWAIRHHPADVAVTLEVAQRYLDRAEG